MPCEVLSLTVGYSASKLPSIHESARQTDLGMTDLAPTGETAMEDCCRFSAIRSIGPRLSKR